MLSVIFRTSAFDTCWLSVAYRLEPACSMKPKWNAAVLAIAWMCAGGPKSAFVLGIAGNLPANNAGSACGNVGAEIGVGDAAVADIPARVDAELHEVGEPADLLSPRRLAARKSSEGIEVDRLRADGSQICVQEFGVADLVERVAGDILGAIGIEVLQGELIWILRSRGNPTELGILLPQIGFDQLRCREQPQNVDVSRTHSAGRVRRASRRKQCARGKGRAS